jgi:Spy/CpxP family protein refolding chaperone
MTMKSVRVAIMVVLLIIAGTIAHAQQGPGQSGNESAQKREEVRKKIETVRLWRLTEELKLDEKTGAKLASFLSALDEQRRDAIRERMHAVQDLHSVLKSGKPDERKLKDDLAKFEKARREMTQLDIKETQGLKGILSIEQQARYVIFQQEFRREMRRMIAGARNGGRGPGNGPRGGNVPMRKDP